MFLLQVTFVYLIYLALVLCYASQAAFISKNLRASMDIVHLSESVPNSEFFGLCFIFHVATSTLFIILIVEHFVGSGLLCHIFRVLSLFVSAVESQATITASFSIIN